MGRQPCRVLHYEGFVPLKVTGVPEDEQVFFENGDFEGLLKHMQEKGEIGTAKPSKKVK